MIKFFRSIRQNLLSQGKTGKYLKYAMGEIVLVVIGILIALSINDWNDARKNRNQANVFLLNLQQDLRADSLRLQEIRNTLKVAVSYKVVFEDHVAGNVTDRDSLHDHLLMQYNLLVDFVPNSVTVEEVSNNGHNLISDPKLRRQIIITYNTYDDLILKLKIGQEKGQNVINYVSRMVNDINSPTEEEIQRLLQDKFYVNQTRMNFLSTQLKAVDQTIGQCDKTLLAIRKELHRA